MSIVADKVFPSQIKRVIHDLSPRNQVLAPIKTAPKKSPKPNPELQLTPSEAMRELRETFRRKTVQAAIELLLVKSVTQKLERISKAKSEHQLGFRPTKEPNPEDLKIKNMADKIINALNIYATPQNMQVAIGFIETVELIDELERLGNENQGQGFGFHQTTPQKEDHYKQKALEYASELREKIIYMLDWLEVPKNKPSPKNITQEETDLIAPILKLIPKKIKLLPPNLAIPAVS